MNNKKFKNYIYENSIHSDIPYGKYENVDYSNNHNITQIGLNNTFNQLIDNDLYIEKSIKNFYSYTPGPKTADEQSIINGENGYKYWNYGSDDNVAIMRKNDKSIWESVYKTNINNDIYCIFDNDDLVLIGTDVGIYEIKKDGTYKQISNNISYCRDIKKTPNGNIFACASDGLYRIKITEEYNVGDESITNNYEIYKRNKTEIQNCRTMLINNGTIFIGTDSGIFKGNLSYDSLIEDVVFDQLNVYINNEIDTNILFNDLIKLTDTKIRFGDSENIIASTNKGLFNSQVEKTTDNRNIICQNVDVNFVFSFEERIYAGTNIGLYDITNNSYVVNGNMTCFQLVENSIFLGTKNGKIIKYIPSKKVQKIIKIDDNEIKSITSLKPKSSEKYVNVLLVLKSNGILNYIDCDTMTLQSSPLFENVDNVFSNNKNNIFIITKDTKTSFKIYNTSRVTFLNTDFIDNLQKYKFNDNQLVDYIKNDEEDILFTKDKVININNSNQLIFKSLNSVKQINNWSKYRYGVKDDKKIYFIDKDTTTTSHNTIEANIFDTTDNLVIISDGSTISTLSKYDFDVSRISLSYCIFENGIQNIESDNNSTYVHSGSNIYNLFETSQFIKNEIIDCIDTTNITYISTTDDSLFVYSDINKIYTHQISSDDLDTIVIKKEYDLSTNYMFSDESKLYVAAKTGLYRYGITKNTSGELILNQEQWLYQNKNVNDYKILKSSNNYEFVSINSSLSIIVTNTATHEIENTIHICDDCENVEITTDENIIYCYVKDTSGSILEYKLNKTNISDYTWDEIFKYCLKMSKINEKICALDESQNFYNDIHNPDEYYQITINKTINRITYTDHKLYDILSVDDSDITLCTKDGIYCQSKRTNNINSTTKYVDGPVDVTCIKKYFNNVYASTTDGKIYLLNKLSSTQVFDCGNFYISDFIFDGYKFFVKDSTGDVYCVQNGYFEQVLEDSTSFKGSNLIRIYKENDDTIFVMKDGLYTVLYGYRCILETPQYKRSVEVGTQINKIIGSKSSSNSDLLIIANSDYKKTIYSYSYDLNKINKKYFEGEFTSFDYIFVSNDDIDSKCNIGNNYGNVYIAYPNEMVEFNDKRLYNKNIRSVSTIGDNIYFCTESGIFVSGKGDGREIDNIKMTRFFSNDSKFFNFLKIDDTNYQIASEIGTYTLNNYDVELSDSIYKNEYEEYPVNFIGKISLNGLTPTYVQARQNYVYASDNMRVYDYKFNIDTHEIRNIHSRNKHELLIATDSGLYATKYMYTLSNDIIPFTKTDATELVNSLNPLFESQYNENLQEHIEEYHNEDSLITYLNNNFMTTDFKQISTTDWTKKIEDEEYLIISDDIVYNIEFGDQDYGDIELNLSNFLKVENNVKFQYIHKKYMSGISELYIHVPTTNTYYINHIDGVTGCKLYTEDMNRQNLRSFPQNKQSFVSDPSKQYSIFDIVIDGSLINIEQITELQVQGMSLPLKVYKDKNQSGIENKLCERYHSIIEPSISLTPYAEIYTNESGYCTIRFACFGTDEQSIRIIAIDKNKINEYGTYRVRFNSNGGKGSMTMQRFIIGQSKNLKKCQFTISDSKKSFFGWSTTPNPKATSEIKYIDQDEMLMTKEEIKDGDIIDLYAIWGNMTQQDMDNQTILSFDDNTEDLFINSADILEGGDGTTIIEYT